MTITENDAAGTINTLIDGFSGITTLRLGPPLLLDEIGDMSLPLQAKLLHVLQSEGEFSPLGSEKEVKADTWVIAATNHDLKKDIDVQKKLHIYLCIKFLCKFCNYFFH